MHESSRRWVEAYEAEVRRGIEGLADCDRVWWRRSLDRLRQVGFIFALTARCAHPAHDLSRTVE